MLANVEKKKAQVLALLELGWNYRRIEAGSRPRFAAALSYLVPSALIFPRILQIGASFKFSSSNDRRCQAATVWSLPSLLSCCGRATLDVRHAGRREVAREIKCH